MAKKNKPDYFHGDAWFCGNVHARVLKELHIPKPRSKTELKKLVRHPLYKEEFKRQSGMFREERMELSQRNRERNAAGREARELRAQRDAVWGREHEADTDEELLAYVRQCAEELGRSPRMRDVLGGDYISSRFGSWALVLMLAELPIPKSVGAVSPQTLKAYRKRMRAKGIETNAG